MNEPRWLLRIDNYRVIWSFAAPTLMIEGVSGVWHDIGRFHYIQLLLFF